jgi:hypothetical protein
MQSLSIEDLKPVPPSKHTHIPHLLSLDDVCSFKIS